MSLKIADHKLKAQELRKIGDEIATYKEHLTKFYAPDAWSASGSILPARKKDKLVAEAKASNGRLTRSRQVLIGLLKKCSTESADGREMKEKKDQIEERMSRQLQLDVDVKKSPGFNRVLSAGVALSTDERARADAVAFLTGAMTTLRRHIERAEAAVERTVVIELASTRNGASVERDETIVKLLEMTEEREWMVDRLEKVERRLVNEEVEPKQVMALEGGVRPLMEAADDADLRADRTMFASIGLDDDAIDWRTPSVNNQKRSSALATESASQSTTASTWRGETSSPGGWGTLEIDDGASSNSAQVDEIMPGYKLVGPGKTLSVVERPRPPNYRTVACKYGSTCSRHDDHTPPSKPASGPVFNQRPCHYFMTGRCLKGDACDFMHSTMPRAQAAVPARPVPTYVDYPSLPIEDGPEVSFDSLGKWADEPYSVKSRFPSAGSSAAAKPSTTPPVKQGNFKYKTVLCNRYDGPGGCHKGHACQFAHGPSGPRFGSESSGDSHYSSAAAAMPRAATSVSSGVQPYGTPTGSSRVQSPTAYVTAPSSVASSAASLPAVDMHARTSPNGEALDQRSVAVMDAAHASSEATPPATVSAAGSNGSTGSNGRTPSSFAAKPVLLPLGHGACLTWFLRGRCANEDCLNRHVLNASDFAAGVLPRLGPGGCLNWHLRGRCGNHDDCLSRHVLTEADYSADGWSA